MNRSIVKLAGYVIGFGSLFVIWHLASVYLLNSVLFPPPARVIGKAVELARDGTLWENASISLVFRLVSLLARSPSCGASWSLIQSSYASSRQRP